MLVLPNKPRNLFLQNDGKYPKLDGMKFKKNLIIFTDQNKKIMKSIFSLRNQDLAQCIHNA